MGGFRFFKRNISEENDLKKMSFHIQEYSELLSNDCLVNHTTRPLFFLEQKLLRTVSTTFIFEGFYSSVNKVFQDERRVRSPPNGTCPLPQV